jgi:hypothetical protein
MDTDEVTRELEAAMPGRVVRAAELAKKGLRADSYWVTFADASDRFLAKRFRSLDAFAANECASYRLFATKTLNVAPRARFVADDDRWLVLEDVRGDDLMAALATRPPDVLMDKLARTLSTLAIGTADSAASDTTRRNEAETLLRRWPDVLRWSERLGVASPTELRAQVSTIVDADRKPALVAWTQGDPAPSNVLFSESSAVLVDFEYGAYRHALHDLAQWSIRIPLPFQWHVRLEAAVGEALVAARAYPDLAAFHDDFTVMAGYAALYMFTWVPIERTLTEDVPWAPGFDARSALLSTSNRLASRVRAIAPALSEWSERVFTVLSRKWPERRLGAIDWRALSS